MLMRTNVNNAGGGRWVGSGCSTALSKWVGGGGGEGGGKGSETMFVESR